MAKKLYPKRMSKQGWQRKGERKTHNFSPQLGYALLTGDQGGRFLRFSCSRCLNGLCTLCSCASIQRPTAYLTRGLSLESHLKMHLLYESRECIGRLCSLESVEDTPVINTRKNAPASSVSCEKPSCGPFPVPEGWLEKCYSAPSLLASVRMITFQSVRGPASRVRDKMHVIT